jgi:signal transduction histidine kinase
VAEEDRHRVFERFVSADGRGGSGLGLPVARGLARAMDGDLYYDDGFVVTLPAVGPATTGKDTVAGEESRRR